MRNLLVILCVAALIVNCCCGDPEKDNKIRNKNKGGRTKRNLATPTQLNWNGLFTNNNLMATPVDYLSVSSALAEIRAQLTILYNEIVAKIQIASGRPVA